MKWGWWWGGVGYFQWWWSGNWRRFGRRKHSNATTLDTDESQETNKRKIVVAPYKNTQQVRSNKQALSEVANSLQLMAETSLKYFKMMAEEDKRREERYMAFQWEEAERNQEHELCIAEIFARTVQPTSPPNFCFSHFPLRLVTFPHQGVHIFQTKRQD